MVGRGGVQFRQRGQTFLFELRGIPTAHRRQKLALWNAFRPRRNQFLYVGDRRRRFDPRVMARTQAERHDMVVIVDQTRHHGAPVQIDRFRAGTGLAGILLLYKNRMTSADPISVAFSGELLAMVVIGGMRSFLGPALGALFFILFREFLGIIQLGRQQNREPVARNARRERTGRQSQPDQLTELPQHRVTHVHAETVIDDVQLVGIDI